MSASMPTSSPPPAPNAKSPLAEPGMRRVLLDFVRRRVPASDVDDVVQTVLLDALAAEAKPSDEEELRRWLLGIARHKVADHHRRTAREPASELTEIEAHPPPVEERSLARWAEEQAASTSEAQKTLAWMAREGEGEKLESIAAEENVPAARVRQRVSRMRRWMKERWLAELAAVAVLAIAAIVAWRILRRSTKEEMPEARPDDPRAVPSLSPDAPSPFDRARELRADALRKCERAEWQPCLEGLDEAARLDPAGDTAPSVTEARDRARKALDAPPPRTDSIPPAPSATQPAPAPTPVPTGTAIPRDASPKNVTPIEPTTPPAPRTSFEKSPSEKPPPSVKTAPITTSTPPPFTKTKPSKKPTSDGSFDSMKKKSGSKSSSLSGF